MIVSVGLSFGARDVTAMYLEGESPEVARKMVQEQILALPAEGWTSGPLSADISPFSGQWVERHGSGYVSFIEVH